MSYRSGSLLVPLVVPIPWTSQFRRNNAVSCSESNCILDLSWMTKRVRPSLLRKRKPSLTRAQVGDFGPCCGRLAPKLYLTSRKKSI